MADPRLGPDARRAIENAALRTLSPEERRTVSLFIDDRVIRRGQELGLPHEGIRSKHSQSTLVFVDYHPRQDFAHACRYLFFDPANASLLDNVDARFPPYPLGWPPNYERFDERRPSRAREHEPPGRVLSPPVIGPPAPIQGSGRKFAILFAGIPDPCHLNTMEFVYRVLLARDFPAANIVVASYDGATPPTCEKWQGLGGVHGWAGNWTPTGPIAGQGFLMKVSFQGHREGFRKALKQITDQTPVPGDLLFIYTTGHGEGGGTSSSVFLRTTEGDYTALMFKNDLKRLRDSRGAARLGQLVVLMAQCSSGGFQDKVLDSGAAAQIAFASAAQWDTPAKQDADNELDTTWSIFPSDWIASLVGATHNSLPLVQNVYAQNFAGNVAANVGQAYGYAAATPPKDPEDFPSKGYEPPTADQLQL